MAQNYATFNKKQSALALVVTGSNRFVIITNQMYRKKMLRNTKVFVGTLIVRNSSWNLTYTADLLRQWWESVDDVALIQRLNESPINDKPLISFDNLLRIDFNTKRSDLMKAIFDEDSEEYGELVD
jgi:hypothetical protein